MHLTLKSYIKQVEEKLLFPKDVVKHYLSKAKQNNNKYNAFINFYDEYINQNLDKFSDFGLMAAPIGVKDIILTKDLTSCGSQMLKEFRSPYSATCFQNLEKAGGLIIGKTNMDEFAMGSSTETSYFGPSQNFYGKNRVPGGTSGGSAIAVAGDFVIAALGTDTGGSIRQPAAFSNIVGMKPTYGRVSRYGVQSMASSLDQVGVFTKTVEDARILLGSISGFDHKDSQSNKKADNKSFLKSVDLQEVRNLKIVIPKQVFSEGLDPRIKSNFLNILDKLKLAGFCISEVDLPVLSYSLPIYYTLATAEISTNMARFDGIRFGLQDETRNYDDISKYYEKIRSQGFGDEVKRRTLLGTFILSSSHYEGYYIRAQKSRQKLKSDFNKVFGEYDLIILPTTPDIPWKIGEKVDDPIKMYLSDLFTVPANLAGLPAISVPMGMVSDGDELLPSGIQVMGNRRNEKSVLDLAEVIENLQK